MGDTLTSFRLKDERKCFFGVIQRLITIVEDAGAIPMLGILLAKGRKRGDLPPGSGKDGKKCMCVCVRVCGGG